MGCFNSKAVVTASSVDPFTAPVRPLSPVAQEDAARVEALKRQTTDVVSDSETARAPLLVAKEGKAYILSLFIIQARDLPGADRRVLRKRTSDPYVKASIVCADGSEIPAQQTKWMAATLNPVWNHRMDFNLGSKVPTAIKLSCLDYDALSAHDPLGSLSYAVTTEDVGPHRPTRWYQLKNTASGAVQFQVTVEELDPADERSRIKLSTAERTGLLTLRINEIKGLRPGPAAIKALGEHTFRTGAYQLKAYITFGLRSFNGKPVQGVPIPVASPKASNAAPADTASEGPTAPVKQDLKIWQRQGEETYMAQITLVATSNANNKSAVFGKGYANAALLADTAVHVFNVHLREEPLKQQDLTDAEQSAMLAAMGIVPGAATVTSPTSASVVVDGVDGSGFRDAAGGAGIQHTLSHGGVAGEDTPSLSVVSPASSAAPPTTDASGNVIPVHESGLEAGLPGVVTACITLKGALESRQKLEEYFHSKLLELFDSDASGSLDPAEMVAMLHTLGLEASTSEIEAIIREFDSNADGMLDAVELLNWFRSPEFHALPMSYHLLAFIADGKRGVDDLASGYSRVLNTTNLETKAGAGIVALQEGDKEVLVDRGLKVFDRKTGLVLLENIPAAVKTALNLMYHSAAGSAVTKSSAIRKVLHRLSVNEGLKMDKPESRHRIQAFVDLHKINMDECEISEVSKYANFNAFFSRALKPSARPIDSPNDEGIAVSAADCRAVVYPTWAEATKVWIKGQSFTLEKLLGPACADIAPLFMGGSLAVFRLSPQDYHRWHMPVTGRIGKRHPIDGALYTVNPIAVRRAAPSIYDENKREVILVHTKPFGLVALIAVGATVVGSIKVLQDEGTFAVKGDCNGYFSFGGSTVLALFQPGCIEFDADLVNYSRAPLETYIRVGERIGRAVPGSKPLMGLSEDDPDYIAYKAKTATAVAAAGGAVAVQATTTLTAGAPPEAAAVVAADAAADAAAAAEAPASSSS